MDFKRICFRDKNLNESMDVQDPYGMSEKEYKNCAQELKELIDELISRLNSKSK